MSSFRAEEIRGKLAIIGLGVQGVGFRVQGFRVQGLGVYGQGCSNIQAIAQGTSPDAKKGLGIGV